MVFCVCSASGGEKKNLRKIGIWDPGRGFFAVPSFPSGWVVRKFL